MRRRASIGSSLLVAGLLATGCQSVSNSNKPGASPEQTTRLDLRAPADVPRAVGRMASNAVWLRYCSSPGAPTCEYANGVITAPNHVTSVGHEFGPNVQARNCASVLITMTGGPQRTMWGERTQYAGVNYPVPDRSDIAVSTAGTEAKPVTIGNSRNLKVGQALFIIGYPPIPAIEQAQTDTLEDKPTIIAAKYLGRVQGQLELLVGYQKYTGPTKGLGIVAGDSGDGVYDHSGDLEGEINTGISGPASLEFLNVRPIHQPGDAQLQIATAVPITITQQRVADCVS